MKYEFTKRGKWTVLSKAYVDGFGCQYYNCKCSECGEIKCVMKAKLVDIEKSHVCECKIGK